MRKIKKSLILIIVFFLVLVVVCYVIFFNIKTIKIDTMQKGITLGNFDLNSGLESLSAFQLASNYKISIKISNEYFHNKYYNINGPIIKVNKDQTGLLFVSLGGSTEVGLIHCYFKKNIIDESSKLKLGNILSIRGKITDYKIATTLNNENIVDVVVEECEIIK